MISGCQPDLIEAVRIHNATIRKFEKYVAFHFSYFSRLNQKILASVYLLFIVVYVVKFDGSVTPKLMQSCETLRP